MSADTTNTQFLRFKNTEAALHLSEATKTAILATALDCIVTIDHQGFVVDWNPAAEKTFGYSLAEALGQEMAELIIPTQLREMHRRGLARAATTGEDVLAGQRTELIAMRKNGETFPVELAISRISAGSTPLFTGHIRDISERKRTEQVLRESQQLLSSITRNISEAIFRRSINDELVFVNEAYVKIFGYDSAEEVRAVPVDSLYANPQRRADILEALTEHRVVRNEEIEFRRRDGTTFWGLLSATGIRDEKTGRVIHFDGAIHDITERKRADQQRAAEYAVVSALAISKNLEQAAPVILEAVCRSLNWDTGTLWQVDKKTKVLRCVDFWHPPDLSLQGFERSTREATFRRGTGLPGRIWKTARPGWISDVTKDSNFPRAAVASDCNLHGAFGFPIYLGKEVLGVIEFFSREIREPDDRLLAMFSAIGSQMGQFMERKRAELEILQLNKELENRVVERTAELSASNDAFRESEERYRTVAEHTPAAIVVMDTAAGRFIEANENALRLFGLPRKKLLQLGPAEVSPEFQPDGHSSETAASEKIKHALSGSTPVFEWVHRHADGTDIPCEVRVAQMPAAGRKLIIGAITDITMRKKAEEELRIALEQERELSQLKSNFVNLVSHEFRTPLGVIMSAADILENYFQRLSPDQRSGHLQDIRHSTKQMTALMEEVLLLGRVESGKMECRPEFMDLEAFCRRLVNEQRSVTHERCPISLELDTFTGQAKGDDGVMRHIFSNLLSNAVKYSSPKSPVYFSVRRDGESAVFTVRDNGIGISEDDQKRVFETFHRGQNVGEIAGTGLGLVIVKHCVDIHHGTIELSSAVGRGTTVVVRLKLFAGQLISAVKRRKSTKGRGHGRK
jgi:PAS domain S-box-containing protein